MCHVEMRQTNKQIVICWCILAFIGCFAWMATIVSNIRFNQIIDMDWCNDHNCNTFQLALAVVAGIGSMILGAWVYSLDLPYDEEVMIGVP